MSLCLRSKRARRNPKQHDDDAIKASLTRFGIGELPLLDERTGLLVAGEGRINQLESLRETDPRTPPDGIALHASGEWLVPVIKGWASADDKEADAYLIASNRLSESGGWDGMGLAEMLATLEGNLDGIGYDQNELDELLRDTGYMSEQATKFLDELPAPPLPAVPPPAFSSSDTPDNNTPAPAPPPAVSPFAPADSPVPPPQTAPQHSPAIPPQTAPVAGSTEPQWFQLTWTATHDQRETIHAAIRHAREHRSCDTAVAALAVVCQTYLDTVGAPS